jgi:hypothetical protein
VGTIGGQRAEINTNSWAERFDAALIFRVGGAYNVSEKVQVTAAVSWEQSETDEAEAGLIGGQPLLVKFSDYQGWGIDVGGRYFLPPSATFGSAKMKPFVSASLGFQRLQNLTISLSTSSRPIVPEVPFYDDSWVAQWRLGTGFLWDINERFGWQATIDIKYSGVLSDQAGIGTVGFERINDAGNRWTLPILAGVYARF